MQIGTGKCTRWASKWWASITHKKKEISLGQGHNSQKDAALARDA